jgi:hypothetical protein
MELVFNFPGVGQIVYQVPGFHHVFSTGDPQPHNISLSPGDYPQLLLDASTVASLEQATKGVSDDGVRTALQSGIDAAVKALQKRAGNNVTVKQGTSATNIANAA